MDMIFINNETNIKRIILLINNSGLLIGYKLKEVDEMTIIYAGHN